MPHLLRYQGIAVDYYGFTLDALSERSVDPVAGEAVWFLKTNIKPSARMSRKTNVNIKRICC
ncbi:MAG: hypothetical protein JRF25_14105 [Deltaproteobacteria bacterium]|nr:hypothetical protein [Deltaproteobacteria bacterium]